MTDPREATAAWIYKWSMKERHQSDDAREWAACPDVFRSSWLELADDLIRVQALAAVVGVPEPTPVKGVHICWCGCAEGEHHHFRPVSATPEPADQLQANAKPGLNLKLKASNE